MNKFVITTDGTMRFGDVELHRHLLDVGSDECYGGGFWARGRDANELSLYGSSYDFGMPQFEKLKKVDWSGVGGLPLSLRYYPYYPDEYRSYTVEPR